MPLISGVVSASTGRGRQVVLVLCLLAGWSSLESSAAAQTHPLTVLFSPGAGAFVGSETVTLSVPSRADIHYTLDGSLPTVMSPVYRKPITLDKSTRLRAFAVATGTSPREGSAGTTARAERQGPVGTETYLRVARDTQRFTSHLPIILIHTFESGTLDARGTEHVPAAFQVFEPKGGTSRIVGRAALDARIGIHVRGESSRRSPKTQYAVELRADDKETDSARPVLGLPSNADWVLSDPIVYDRSLIRNALAYELSNRIGRYAPRTRFAEVFLVDDGGDVRAESFLGLFTLIEKIDRGSERVNVGRLPASAASLPAMTGGFIVRIDKGMPDFQAGGRWLQFVYPDADDMRTPERKAQIDFITGFINGFVEAVRAPDFRHPVIRKHYSEFIDVDAWIDHNILNALTKNVDGLRYSAYFYKDRDGRLSAGPVWDFDRSMGTPHDYRSPAAEEWNQTFNAADYFDEGWWRFLFRDPQFRARYRDRFKALLNGEFTADNLDRIVDRMTSDVGAAAERNFRRWTQLPPQDDSYATEIALLKNFLRRRVTWIRTQLDTNF